MGASVGTIWERAHGHSVGGIGAQHPQKVLVPTKSGAENLPMVVAIHGGQTTRRRDPPRDARPTAPGAVQQKERIALVHTGICPTAPTLLQCHTPRLHRRHQWP